jgi:hypothetical protein
MTQEEELHVLRVRVAELEAERDRKLPIPMSASDKLKCHVKACPIGWHKGQLKLHRATTTTDVTAWIQELDRLVGVQSNTATKTRLPKPYAGGPKIDAVDRLWRYFGGL